MKAMSHPTTIKDDIYLENWHLRASFTLIRQAPSLLRYMKTFTTGHPPAYLSTFLPTSLESKDPRHSIIDSYGGTIPFIGFHPIKSSCGKSFVEQTERDAEDDDADREAIFVTTEGKSLLDYHPYVVTR
jgi:hypothetical protein